MNSERNTYIDFLRFVGISLVVLAHIKAPSLLFQIRCFDVPLMVFVSGLSYGGKSITASFRNYYVPRICRLVIPVYIFLFFYFFIFAIIGKLQSYQTIFASFLLMNGGSIGYVWIIKVFLLVSLLSPLLLRLSQNLTLFKVIILSVIILWINDIVCYNLIPCLDAPYLKLFISETLPYVLGYSSIFLIGSKCREANVKDLLVPTILICSLFIFLCIKFCFSGASLNLQAYKYPPQSYFLLYGLICSLLFWKCRNVAILKAISANKFVLFVGRNTIWIYLWHILFVEIAIGLIPYWFVRYLFVYFSSIFCFGIQYYMVKSIRSRFNWPFLKHFLG